MKIRVSVVCPPCMELMVYRKTKCPGTTRRKSTRAEREFTSVRKQRWSSGLKVARAHSTSAAYLGSRGGGSTTVL